MTPLLETVADKTDKATSEVRAQAPKAGGERPTGGRISAYVSIARPDHWFKNVFMLVGVLLACFYHHAFLALDSLWWIAIGFAATCITASSNYVINEILDAPTDRHHPVKKNRPIPSGQVMLPVAYAEWLLLGAAGLGLASLLGAGFLLSAALLLIMGVVYNVPPIRAKDLPYVDVLTEAVNNPIRLCLGWFVVSPTEVPPLSLIIAYWMVGAFFMAAKRLSEYRSIGSAEVAGAYRRSFRYYTEQRLLVSMFFYTNTFALFLGIFIIRYHLELLLMVPLVAGFMSYYLAITLKPNSSAMNPEKLYRERGLVLYLTVGMIVFFALMLTHIPTLYQIFNVKASGVPPLWKF